MNPILGSVNIGSVHKSSEIASPLGFLLIHRQQDGGGMCEHNPQHYTRSLAKSRKWKGIVFLTEAEGTAMQHPLTDQLGHSIPWNL